MTLNSKLWLSCHAMFILTAFHSGFAQTLIFKNGFEGTTRVEYKGPQHDNLRGYDNVNTKSDWLEDLEKNPYITFGQITYEQGHDSLRRASVVKDPADSSNKALRFRIVDQHIFIPGTGERKARIQYELQNKSAAPVGGYIKEYYQKNRLYFSPDFKILEDSPTNFGWFIMQEYWNDPSWNVPGGQARKETRVDFEITRKKHAAGEKLRFGAKFRDPINVYPATWEYVNPDFAIPLGTWMTQEIYVKEGDENTGRIYMAITVGNVKTIIVDKTTRTCALTTPTYTPDGQTSWNPMKIYMEGKVANLFKQKGKILDVYWDDVEVWFNRTPESTVLDLSTSDIAQTPILLYPNPSTNHITVTGGPAASELRLYDKGGKVVLNTPLNEETNIVDLSALNPECIFTTLCMMKKHCTRAKS